LVALDLEALALEHIRVEDLDGVHHTHDFFSFCIRYVETKVFLHSEDELNTVEAVETQIFERNGTSEFVVLALSGALQHFEYLTLYVLDQLVFV
jgi:hypothetical protein